MSKSAPFNIWPESRIDFAILAVLIILASLGTVATWVCLFMLDHLNYANTLIDQKDERIALQQGRIAEMTARQDPPQFRSFVPIDIDIPIPGTATLRERRDAIFAQIVELEQRADTATPEDFPLIQDRIEQLAEQANALDLQIHLLRKTAQ
jgi:hypothetical protein